MTNLKIMSRGQRIWNALNDHFILNIGIVLIIIKVHHLHELCLKYVLIC